MSETESNEYEFTEEENKIFARLLKHMLVTTIVLVLAGLTTLIVGITDNFYYYELIAGIATGAIGVSLYFPTDNFKNVINTTGHDIKELLTGFSDLNKGWLVVNIITFLYLLARISLIFTGGHL